MQLIPLNICTFLVNFVAISNNKDNYCGNYLGGIFHNIKPTSINGNGAGRVNCLSLNLRPLLLLNQGRPFHSLERGLNAHLKTLPWFATQCISQN